MTNKYTSEQMNYVNQNNIRVIAPKRLELKI